MKIIQTYYSYANEENPVRDAAGFLSADMNWKSMALSCLLLKKHYGKVALYCNNKVKRLVVDYLKIPYDEVIEMPDFMKKYEGCNLWALPKIYTYSLQAEPFIHVDCDWFMFEKLSESITNSDIIGQNIEYDDQFCNRFTLEKLISNGCNVSPWVLNEYTKEPVLRVINAGILGGNDVDFIQKYVKVIKDFILQNISVIKKINDGFINSIYEQFFFYLLAKNEGKSLGLCTRGDKLSTKFDWFTVDVSVAPKKGYMHLLANLKRRMSSYFFVTNYLDYLSPEISYRISKYCYDNNIRPLVNFPQWDMYALGQSKLCQDTNICNWNNAGMGASVQNIEKIILHMEERLRLFCKQIYREQRNNVIPLWEIHSLWNKDYVFSICPKIVFFKITSEIASSLLSQQREFLERLSVGKESCLILIPDASMMKVHKCVVTGVKAEIIDFLSVRGYTTLSEIGNHLSLKYKISVCNNKQMQRLIDQTIRSMLVGNILKMTKQ